jgi:hypothetical protein
MSQDTLNACGPLSQLKRTALSLRKNIDGGSPAIRSWLQVKNSKAIFPLHRTCPNLGTRLAAFENSCLPRYFRWIASSLNAITHERVRLTQDLCERLTHVVIPTEAHKTRAMSKPRTVQPRTSTPNLRDKLPLLSRKHPASIFANADNEPRLLTLGRRTSHSKERRVIQSHKTRKPCAHRLTGNSPKRAQPKPPAATVHLLQPRGPAFNEGLHKHQGRTPRRVGHSARWRLDTCRRGGLCARVVH